MDVQNSLLRLNGLNIATYTICYKINEGVELTDCLYLNCKKEVSARRFSSLDLQRNLIFVDMIFPNILADIALDAFLGNVHTFSDYISKPKRFTIADELNDTLFYNMKIREFVKLLLFSDIQQEKLSSGTIYSDITYILSDSNGVKQTYDYNQCADLVEMMMQRLKLQADKKNAWVSESELFIQLDIKCV